MSNHLKARIQKEWTVFIIEIILITCTFFYTLELFRSCNCCPIIKALVNIFLVFGMLLSGFYLFLLSNEMDIDKTISILCRFQNLKLFIFLLITASWVMTIIISNNILKVCGNEKDSNIHINNCSLSNPDSLIIGQNKKDTVYVNITSKSIPNTIVNNYFFTTKNKKDIVNRTNDSVSHKNYICSFNNKYKKIDSLENKEFTIMYNITAKNLNIESNKLINEVSNVEFFSIDSLHGAANINKNKRYKHSNLGLDSLIIGIKKYIIYKHDIR